MFMDSSETPEEIAGDTAETAGDYSYDLAHDVPPEADRRHVPQPARSATPQPVEAPAPDPDGDYSYDLAHEVPPAKE